MIAMMKEDAVRLSEDAMTELAAALAAGKSAELVRLLDTMSQFHRYSFGNCLLILQQYPEATLVAGFHAWKKHNRQVKKGAKGICILAPMVGKKEADDGSEPKEVFGFRGVHVFDVSQTEGEDLPELTRVEGDPGEQIARLRAAVERHQIVLSYEDSLGGAEGVSKIGAIVLRRGLSPAEEFSTLAHEWAHERMHSREDRQALAHGIKELEAEAVAYVLAKSAGLANALVQSSDYIQSHAGDEELLAQSLGRIQKTAAWMLAELEAVAAETPAEVAETV